MDDAGTYAMALDGDKRQVDARRLERGPRAVVAASRRRSGRARVADVADGPGHVERLGHPHAVDARWPATTRSAITWAAIWPHDNAICAAGSARYGLSDEARTRRRRAARGDRATSATRACPSCSAASTASARRCPVPYPVACSPQAWAAGSLFQLLSATLGLRARRAGARAGAGAARRCPTGCPGLRLENLRVGEARGRPAGSAADGSIGGRGAAPDRASSTSSSGSERRAAGRDDRRRAWSQAGRPLTA